MSDGLEGGCACGSVRYRLASAPFDAGWCHCRICQHVSGSGGMVFTTVPLSAFRIVMGEESFGKFRSTPFGSRTYCFDCDAPLTIHVRHQPDEIDIAAGSLDTPAAIAPAFHLYAAQAPPWAILADGLPRYDALRPSTRGLKPGQTSA